MQVRRAPRGAVSRNGAVALVMVGLAALGACGTRLPNSDFAHAGNRQAAPAPGTGRGAPGSPGSDRSVVAGASAPGGSGGTTSQGHAKSRTGKQDAAHGKASGGDASNTASDRGVTATTITIGNIVSKTNPFDPRAFVGPAYGIQAFVHWTNAHGGINGRKLVLKSCDDQGSGDANVTCVHRLVDREKVFALVSNAMLDYAGADYVNQKAIPDIGSQPIDTAYYQYPHLWDIYGEEYPRDGQQVGFDGKLYGGTEVYRYFKTAFPDVKKVAGVVVYNQSASERFGNSIADGLRHEGYTVDEKVVNFALPDYDSVAIDFKNKGVQFIYDVIDRQGNVRLCKALDDNDVDFTAKVMTPQSWEQSVGDDYSQSPHCRSKLWVTGMTRSYADTKYQQVHDFRAQMDADGHGDSTGLSEWALEGWAGGQWFADAAASCGADLTRRCVEKFLNTGKPYQAHGLLTPRHFVERSSPKKHTTNCINVARWEQQQGGWVTQVATWTRTASTSRCCPTRPEPRAGSPRPASTARSPRRRPGRRAASPRSSRCHRRCRRAGRRRRRPGP